MPVDTRLLDPDFDDDGKVDVEWYPVPAGLLEAWNELSEEPVRKSRGRHRKTGFGHRDGLEPGMSLELRKNDCRSGNETEVLVLENGRFGWNGDEFPNGHQLLKAITGRERHRLTVRRYFKLEAGNE